MKNWRENSRLAILPVAVLLGLLVILAFLQYRWLGQISEGEREHLQKRLQTDSQRFAEDFNREISTAYFAFQMEAEIWREPDFNTFHRRFEDWRENVAFPKLIKDIYLVRGDKISHFDLEKKTFVPADWAENFSELREKLKSDNHPATIDEKNTALLLPIYENGGGVYTNIAKPPPPLASEKLRELPLKMPATFGFLILRLDENIIKNEIFPALARKYFLDGEGANYKLAVVSKADESEIIFASDQTAKPAKNTSDISIPLFDNAPDNFLLNPELLRSKMRENSAARKTIIFSQRVESKNVVTKTGNSNRNTTIQVRVSGDEKPRLLQTSDFNENGRWLLLVQHADGSLDQFINNTRRKNLFVSFGILSLLAISGVLVFLSAHRAQKLAQRQLNFVSAVSHEFRTPLAVIYSAGENLTDGIVNSEQQVIQYGNLIKREGKNLAAMVEQILEFAGARSGRKKYNFSPTDVAAAIENALAECQPLIAEKGVQLEKNIAPDLPPITADANALSHAIQNLLNNAVKYGNGAKFLKISAENGNGTIKIRVEDRGIGISPQEISQIFTPFFRGKDVIEAQIHGNGLGLSLVKQTVDAHGGKISVASKIGGGSLFTIELKAGGSGK